MAVNALVGGMLGQERTVLLLLARDTFAIASYRAVMIYIAAFGLAKATTNHFAGTWPDRFGPKPVLGAGWLVALPVPVLLIVAPSWNVVIAANVLLGISQGLTWSTTVIMKIGLVGPRSRGLAMGLTEAAGYIAVAAPRWPPDTSPRPTACGPPRSFWGWSLPRSVWVSRRCWSARLATTRDSRPLGTTTPPERQLTPG